MRGKWILALGVAAILAGGGAALWKFRQPAAKPQTAVPPPPQELPPGAEVQFPGKIRAANVIRVAAPIDGTLEEFPVRPGDEVFEGQIIGRIQNDGLTAAERDAGLELERAQAKVQALESALIAARLEQSRLEAEQNRARAELAQKERTYRRQELLNREGATPRRAFDTALQEFQSARNEAATIDELLVQLNQRVEKSAKDIELAKKSLEEESQQYEKAKADLAAAEIHSPADGVIVSIKKLAGEEVSREMPDLFEIAVELTSLEIPIEPDPQVLKRVKPGQDALVRVAEVTGGGIPAKVKSVDGGVVVVEFASPDPVLRPGMTAMAVLKLP
jgi:multidrug resistance efflux pump